MSIISLLTLGWYHNHPLPVHINFYWRINTYIHTYNETFLWSRALNLYVIFASIYHIYAYHLSHSKKIFCTTFTSYLSPSIIFVQVSEQFFVIDSDQFLSCTSYLSSSCHILRIYIFYVTVCHSCLHHHRYK